MPSQHEVIHAGLVDMTAYVEAVKGREREFRFEELKKIMEGFEETLWRHLEEEVQQLGADNMRRFWTVSEMRAMAM